MFKSVLVPLDGSALSGRALPFAKRLARAAGAPLIVVRAHLPTDDALSLRLHHPELAASERADAEREAAETEFQSAVDELRKDGLDVEPHFVEGVAADVIFETAKVTRANLIVMSTHGRGGLSRFVYGSVADGVLQRMPVPVLLISAGCNQSWAEHKPQPVVVALDGSSLAAEALRPARDLAVMLGAEMLLVTVVEPIAAYPHQRVAAVSDLDEAQAVQAARYLDKVAAELRSSSAPPVSARIAHGDAAEEICAVAREVGASAIALATHGRGGLTRLLLGSVAIHLLQQSNSPVLVYRPIAVRQTLLESAVEKVAANTASG